MQKRIIYLLLFLISTSVYAQDDIEMLGNISLKDGTPLDLVEISINGSSFILSDSEGDFIIPMDNIEAPEDVIIYKAEYEILEWEYYEERNFIKVFMKKDDYITNKSEVVIEEISQELLYTIKVKDDMGNILPKLKLVINGTRYITDNDGNFTNKVPITRESAIVIDSFEVVNSEIVDTNIINLTLSKTIAFTDAGIIDTVYVEYKKNIKKIAMKLEVDKKHIEASAKKLRKDITALTDRLEQEDVINEDQRIELKKYVYSIERVIKENEKSYMRTKELTDSALFKMKMALLEKDSLILWQNRALKEKDVEKEAIAKAHQKKMIIYTVLVIILLGLVIISYIIGKKIKKQKDELQELISTKDKFFSIMAHDLKGPLNSLSGYSNLIVNYIESLSQEELKKIGEDLENNIKNLFNLLENLLHWARSQQGRIEYIFEDISLNEVVKENVELLTATAENKKIKLVNNIIDEVTVHADKNSLNTVIRNLISNALKFTPEEGLISINLTQSGSGKHQINITDTGVGVPKQVQDMLFRIDSKHSTKGTANEKGTGLGLILCKEFVEQNGGSIWVDSIEGEGSTFSFTLPKN